MVTGKNNEACRGFVTVSCRLGREEQVGVSKFKSIQINPSDLNI